MFNVHQGAAYIPSECSCGSIVSAEGRIMEDFSACVSRDGNGVLHLSMANPYLDKAVTAEVSFESLKPGSVTGEILCSDRVDAYNDFGVAPAVAPKAFKDVKISGKTLKISLPAASVVVLEIK